LVVVAVDMACEEHTIAENSMAVDTVVEVERNAEVVDIDNVGFDLPDVPKSNPVHFVARSDRHVRRALL
jgi:hypothetical protein